MACPPPTPNPPLSSASPPLPKQPPEGAVPPNYMHRPVERIQILHSGNSNSKERMHPPPPPCGRVSLQRPAPLPIPQTYSLSLSYSLSQPHCYSLSQPTVLTYQLVWCGNPGSNLESPSLNPRQGAPSLQLVRPGAFTCMQVHAQAADRAPTCSTGVCTWTRRPAHDLATCAGREGRFQASRLPAPSLVATHSVLVGAFSRSGSTDPRGLKGSPSPHLSQLGAGSDRSVRSFRPVCRSVSGVLDN
ncbi:hypothetical protein M758_8G157100 [Ceratodon purpureus]|nr:hypothetical protein M758_8G157100 [Ceratodon purpureus]